MNLLSIYVTNLGKYNEGELVGEWLQLPCTEEELQETFKNIGINEEYEEYFITDYESECGIEINEYSSIKKLNEQLEELEPLIKTGTDLNKLNAMVNELRFNLTEVVDNWNDYEFIDGQTAEDYIYEMINDNYDLKTIVDSWLYRYITIDYQAIAEEDDRLYETNEGLLIEL